MVQTPVYTESNFLQTAFCDHVHGVKHNSPVPPLSVFSACPKESKGGGVTTASISEPVDETLWEFANLWRKAPLREGVGISYTPTKKYALWPFLSTFTVCLTIKNGARPYFLRRF